MTQPVGLTTLENLRMHVQRDKDDERVDDKLVFYGEMMSQRVIDYCKREFLPDPAGEDDEPVSRVFEYDGSGFLDLGIYDLRTAATLEIDSGLADGSTRNLAATEYRLAPVGKSRQGTYLGVELINLRALGFNWQVTITGAWGMAAVPKPIEGAVLIAVDDVMKNPASMASQQLGGYTVNADHLDIGFDLSPRGGLPRAALWACNPYRRRRTITTLQLRRPIPRTGLSWPAL